MPQPKAPAAAAGGRRGGGLSPKRTVGLVLVVLVGLFIGFSVIGGSKVAKSGSFTGSSGSGQQRAPRRASVHGDDAPPDALPDKHIGDIAAPVHRNPKTQAPPKAFHGERHDDLADPRSHGRPNRRSHEEDDAAVARAKQQKRNAMADGAFRGVTCPPYDPFIDSLQIPLKHLPRKKKTSVAEKYNRRSNNCASNGIWNRVRIDDHHKILHHMVRLGQVKRGSFVLDWGSGCGHSLQFLNLEYNVHGVGLDVSNMTIAYARENTTKANMHCVADGSRLQWLPTDTFDHVISFGSIYHVYNRTMFCHVLRQLVRVIRPGGTVYNGWTENGEFHRKHMKKCLADLPATFKILEEGVEFKDVEVYPLKAQQHTPNTYSLVITKTGEFSPKLEAIVDDINQIPIECGVHRCEERGSGLIADDTPKPDPKTPPPMSPLPTMKRLIAGEAEGDAGDDVVPPPTTSSRKLAKKKAAADEDSEHAGGSGGAHHDDGAEEDQSARHGSRQEKKQGDAGSDGGAAHADGSSGSESSHGDKDDAHHGGAGGEAHQDEQPAANAADGGAAAADDSDAGSAATQPPVKNKKGKKSEKGGQKKKKRQDDESSSDSEESG